MQNRNGKFEQQHKRRLPLSVWLGYLVAITLVLNGVTLSKYVSAASGSATAQVAKFNVQMASSQTAAVIPHDEDSCTYTFSVTSDSEVTVTYKLKVSFTENLPSGVTIRLGNETKTGDGSVKDFEFTGGEFSTGNGTHNYSLIISIDRNILKTDYDPTVTVTAIAEQVD